jgi:hypothetical protein
MCKGLLKLTKNINSMERNECPVGLEIGARLEINNKAGAEYSDIVSQIKGKLIFPNVKLQDQNPGEYLLKCPMCGSFYLCSQENK